ncbi:MAG: hypothetical protein K8E24_000705 [Methanobacterium paludis]|nr:hypothetical protein [Methanobacterium paludis]
MGKEDPNQEDPNQGDPIQNEKSQCNVNGCGCSANYIYLGIAVILLVMFVATTIK